LIDFGGGNCDDFGKPLIDLINGLHQRPVFAGQLVFGKLEYVDLTRRGLRLYLAELEAAFLIAIAGAVPLVAKIGIEPRQIGFQMRYMSKRWGSCTKEGKIILNPELVAAPKECIDYVITHELCHLKARNHSQAFYKLLGMVMKDWEITKERLNQIVEVRFV
jgi:predicted metal-dependent hydrolase